MSDTIDRKLCLGALQMAVRNRKPAPGLVHHTGRGSQYASVDYQAALHAVGLVCSMSRRGNCWDNAVAESFFAPLKQELCHRLRFASRDEARRAIFEYIEIFYNSPLNQGVHKSGAGSRRRLAKTWTVSCSSLSMRAASAENSACARPFSSVAKVEIGIELFASRSSSGTTTAVSRALIRPRRAHLSFRFPLVRW